MTTNSSGLKTKLDKINLFAKENLHDEEEDAKLFLLSAALRVWGAASQYDPAYAEAVETIIGTRYTFEQVNTAMECASSTHRLLAPQFLKSLIAVDLLQKTSLAFEYIKLFADCLFEASRAGFGYTEAKAKEYTKIMQDLIDFSRSCGCNDKLENVKIYHPTIAEEQAACLGSEYPDTLFTHISARLKEEPRQADDNDDVNDDFDDDFEDDDDNSEDDEDCQDKAEEAVSRALAFLRESFGDIGNAAPAETPAAQSDAHTAKPEEAAPKSDAADSKHPPAEPNNGTDLSKSSTTAPKSDALASSSRPNMKDESKNKYFTEEPTMPWIKETKPSDAFSLHVPDDQTLEELYEELNSLVGLDMVKRDVRSLVNFIKISSLRSERGMKVPDVSYHLVFTGNPGTGKTTIARLVAKLYHHMGLLPEGQLIESDRSSLVAGYMGQTAIKTQKVIRNAIGGVLFIDEAYSLVSSDDDSYGKEAVETLLKAMEDNRGEFVVIVAGYDELMHKFIDSNPGLSSRFNKYFRFDDYTGGQMLEIFHRFCKISGYSLEAEAVPILEAYLEEKYQKREEHFGNARMVRNIFEKAISAQADRLAALSDFTDHDLESITSADIQESLAKMQ